VLADTGPLYAARDPDDSHHERSQGDLARLKAQNLKVVVPYPAYYQEACVTILPYRDQDISLFDAVIAKMSERLEAPVWTYDYHFDTMRADVWR
jgi:uncharacterized protein